MSDLPTLRSNESAPDGQRPVPARRRMLKIGASTAPVMLTLLSRPVLGIDCMTASTMGSTLHASHSPQILSCAGSSLASWMAATTWPDPYKKTTKHGANGWDATLYHCLTTGLGGTTFSGKTMLDVMQLSDDGSVRTLGRYITAALLNSRSNRTPVLSETTVRNMWNAYLAPGYYEPTAGVRWGAPQIVAYIKTTMG
jgi:hypothetical protein